MNLPSFSRRNFLRLSLAGAGGALTFPTVIPASVLGQDAPSHKVQIGQIGCGRIANEMDLPGILKHHQVARVIAVCDLDTRRLQLAKARVEKFYAGNTGAAVTDVKAYGDYRELLKQPGIDAIAVSTPAARYQPGCSSVIDHAHSAARKKNVTGTSVIARAVYFTK